MHDLGGHICRILLLNKIPCDIHQTAFVQNHFLLLAGYMTLSYKIHVFRLYELDSAAYLVTNVAYGAFILLLLYMVVSMATKASRSRSKYLCHVSTWAELVLFSLGLGTISIFYLKNTSGKRSLSTIRNSPCKYICLNLIHYLR